MTEPTASGARRLDPAETALALRHFGPLGLLLVLALLHEALDRPDPSRAWAGLAMSVLFLVALAAAVAQVWLAGRRQAWWAWGALLPSLLLWHLPLWWTLTSYNDQDALLLGIPPIWLMLAYPLVHAVVLGIAMLLRPLGGWSARHGVVAGWSAGFCAAVAVAAVRILATLDQQVESARAAHEAPPVTLVALCLVLLLAAAHRRNG